MQQTSSRGPLWDWGFKIEAVLRDRLQREGKHILPASLIRGGAPMIVGHLRSHVSPDALVMERGKTWWGEFKGKSYCDKFQRLNQWQQGIDLPNWKAYREVERESGLPGMLYVLQMRPGKQAEVDPVLLWQTFEELEKHVQIVKQPHTTFSYGAAYFPIPAFKCRRVAGIIPHAPDVPRVSHPWDQKSKDGVAPKWTIIECDESPFEQSAVPVCCHCGRADGNLQSIMVGVRKVLLHHGVCQNAFLRLSESQSPSVNVLL